MQTYQRNGSTINNIEELKGKRILFACVPGDGHFNPLVPIAIHLKEMGNDVRWYTSNKFEPKIEKLGIPYYPLKKALDIASAPPEELFPERSNYKGKVKRLVFDITNGFIYRGPEYFEDIKEIYQTFPFDVVVADCMLFAIPFIKHILQVPVVAIGVVPVLESSKDIAPPGLGMTPHSNFFGKIKSRILDRIVLKIFSKPAQTMRSILQEYGIEMTNPRLFDYVSQEPDILLQLGVPGFEYKRSDMSKNIRFIGASLPRSTNHKSWHHEKLRKYRKIVLVTQGTVETDVSKIIIPTIEAFKNSEYLVIATTGGSNTEKLRQDYHHDNIIIEDFIPYDTVMPMVDVYVTNGGYGGVTFSIENKLPMVVAGIHEGKSEINARVGYFKIGINLKTEKPSPEKIKKAVETILADKGYRKNIEALSNEFSKFDSKALTTKYIIETLRNNRTISSIGKEKGIRA